MICQTCKKSLCACKSPDGVHCSDCYQKLNATTQNANIQVKNLQQLQPATPNARKAG